MKTPPPPFLSQEPPADPTVAWAVGLLDGWRCCGRSWDRVAAPLAWSWHPAPRAADLRLEERPERDALVVARAAARLRERLRWTEAVDRFGDEAPDSAAWRRVLEAALRSPYAAARSRAVLRWAQLELPGLDDVLRAGAVDRARALRFVAQHRLRKRGGSVAEEVRAAQSDPPSPGGLLALGEVGEAAEDIERLEAHLDDRSGLAAAALIRIAALDPDLGGAWSAALLGDPRPGVAREAGRLLKRGPMPLPYSDLADLVFSPPHGHTVRRALPLALRLPPFEGLRLVLEAAARFVEPALTHGLLRAWIASARRRALSEPPGPELRPHLLRALCASPLSPPVSRELRRRIGG